MNQIQLCAMHDVCHDIIRNKIIFYIAVLAAALRNNGRRVTCSSSDVVGGHKRTTGEAGIATAGVFRELDWELQWKLRDSR